MRQPIGTRGVWLFGVMLGTLIGAGDARGAQSGPPGGAATRPGDARREGRLQVGDKAPDFSLKTLAEGEGDVKLSGFLGKRPVVLVFASYT